MGTNSRTKYDLIDGTKQKGRPKTGYIDPKGKNTVQTWCYLCDASHPYGNPCFERRW